MLFKDPPPDQPYLPNEVLRRVLHWRLHRSPSYAGRPTEATYQHANAGDELGGMKARQVALDRAAQLKNLQKDALELMLVCKAWKVS